MNIFPMDYVVSIMKEIQSDVSLNIFIGLH